MEKSFGVRLNFKRMKYTGIVFMILLYSFEAILAIVTFAIYKYIREISTYFDLFIYYSSYGFNNGSFVSMANQYQFLLLSVRSRCEQINTMMK